MKASNQAKNREINKNLVLKLIIQNSPISRIELSKMTKLTKMTITNIVNELITEGLVQETDKIVSTTGRNPIGLSVIDGCRYIVGLYVFRRFITSFIGDIKGNITMSEMLWFESEETRETVTSKIYKQIDRIINNVPSNKIIGIGVSACGPLNSKTGVIINPPNFYNIKNLELKKLLQDRYKLPVYIENDMCAAALAEKYYGNAKHVQNFVYFGLTNGIGTGTFINDRLNSSETGWGGEIGHITIDHNGPKCSCGNNGCLELYARMRAGYDDLDEEGKYIETKRICKYLAIGCISLINLFGPEVIYFGHDFEKLNVVAADLIRQEIEGKYISRNHSPVRIELSKFGNKAADYGAIANFVDKMVF